MAAPNEVTFRLPRCPRSVPRARAALLAVLGDWGVDQEVLGNAELVLSELVTNALLRLEVSDAGAGTPELREPGDEETGGRGLLLVEALALRWGVEKRAGGVGKTVFAELKAPDIVAEPVETELAAVMVHPGQYVRVWGAWRAVLDVHTEQHESHESTVVLTLDEGPALRVHATEPLTVRRRGDG
ncbi:ATP-binding protein [Streptomyces sp. NBC_00343]|uniref:ATP-binding protein n=1 Tax=Streptomyces sp. NBC_00343 TaxID=2975719 RepID=UPI002E27BC5F|nr:ATP-binding protein [Streptomyces sp. NBC_00343]